jgi:methylated-DNA-[protein]-cysteine S-methyltransferase
MTTHYLFVESPIGPLLLTSNGTSLTRLYINAHKNADTIQSSWLNDSTDSVLAEAKRQLDAYFAGDLKEFDLPLAPAGTGFQQRVWKELLAIGYGETQSYGEVARRLGEPHSSRAVGLANGSNPISIVIPCHRVIGANGKLTGYGGGLPRKAALLDFEKAVTTGGSRRMPPLIEVSLFSAGEVQETASVSG